MDKIIVEGGRPLEGEVRISGAKNAALPILMSSLLTDVLNTCKNVPQLKDIESTKSLLARLGSNVKRRGRRSGSMPADLTTTRPRMTWCVKCGLRFWCWGPWSPD